VQDRCFDLNPASSPNYSAASFVQHALCRHAADARTPTSIPCGPRTSNKRVGSTSSWPRSLASPRADRYHRHVLKKKPCTRGAGHAEASACIISAHARGVWLQVNIITSSAGHRDGDLELEHHHDFFDNIKICTASSRTTATRT
jgi:hypothetical protein